jgi:hypothetical protein
MLAHSFIVPSRSAQQYGKIDKLGKEEKHLEQPSAVLLVPFEHATEMPKKLT